jgi:ABC-type Mn2+/Zn2+ transport system permease subunit
MLVAWSTASIASLGGLLFAYFYDFSVGPAIALFLGAVLTIVALFIKFRKIQSIDKISL